MPRNCFLTAGKPPYNRNVMNYFLMKNSILTPANSITS